MTDTSTDTSRNWVLALAALASFAVALDAMVLATALSRIQADLGASLHQLEWTVNGYNLSFAVLLTVGAALGERFGRKRIFLIGVSIFTLASIACALSRSVEFLISARIGQGAGAACIMPMAMAMLGAAFPREVRGKALGKFGMITGLAVLSGPVLGGAVAEGLDWRWIFWINVPIGLALVLFGSRRLWESRGNTVPVDVPGVLLLAGTAFGFTWELIRTTELGWGHPEVTAGVAVTAALAVLFVIRQRMAIEPMLPPHLFAHRGFTGGLLATFLHYGALYGTLFFIAQFFQLAQGYTPLQAGLRVLPWTATLFFAAPVAGNLIHKIGERPLICTGLLLEGAGLAVIALSADRETGLLVLALPLVVAGIGASMSIPAMQSAVMGSVDAGQMGKATGAFGVSQFLGGATGISLGILAFSLYGNYGDPAGFVPGCAAAVTTASAMALLGSACAGLIVPSRPAAGT